ncbi:MAG: ferredoxin [Planctomycetota bacterium]
MKINSQEVSNVQKEKGNEMRVYVDSELCEGCGPCVDICPEAFELNDEGIAIVMLDDVPEELQEICREALENCPTEAISIEE